MNQKNRFKSDRIRNLALMAVFTALAFVVALTIRFPVPPFLTLDLKDAVIAIAAMAIGPSAALVITAAVTLLALLLSGIATAVLNEFVCLILYTLCCTAFCLLIMQIFRNLRLFAATIPLFVISMGVFCPVFFDLRQTAILGHLFPPTYYINAAYSNSYKLYMLLYLTALIILLAIIQKIAAKKRI